MFRVQIVHYFSIMNTVVIELLLHFAADNVLFKLFPLLTITGLLALALAQLSKLSCCHRLQQVVSGVFKLINLCKYYNFN